jgi:hypothetical protein
MRELLHGSGTSNFNGLFINHSSVIAQSFIYAILILEPLNDEKVTTMIKSYILLTSYTTPTWPKNL